MSIRAFYSRVIAWFDVVSTFLKPAAAALVAGGGVVLIAAARAAVMAVAADPSLLTAAGGAKRDAAFKLIAADLAAKGLPVVVNAVNIAIEAAVAALAQKT
jgi:hypothetical protein